MYQMPKQEIQVIFEDSNLLVIDKPAGWVVNDANTTQNPTIQDWISKNFNFETAKSKAVRGGIVHRLDKETSGCLIIAKTESDFYKLQAEFADRVVHKTYLALVHGKLNQKSGMINATVGRLPRGGKFGVIPDGRDAITNYEAEEEYAKDGQDYSLVKLTPQTGRTHQIRIHMKYIHHPLVADPLYAGRKTARQDRKWCPRLFLHASSISFTHPQTDKKITVDAPIPPDLEKVLHSFSR